MYRVIDTLQLVGALRDCAFANANVVLRVDLADSFLAVNAGAYTIGFSDGRPHIVDSPTRADVDLAVDVADFSALVMGSVRLRSLVAYGRATLSQPQWLRRLDAAFAADPPQCLTRF